MSYDLTARSDDEHSESIPRARVAAILAEMPDVQPNGRTGFTLERGDDLWMGIDLEMVSDEGDSLELDHAEDAGATNCIRFHVPYGFIGQLDTCLATARDLAEQIGWELFDDQTGEPVPAVRGRRPWWRFW